MAGLPSALMKRVGKGEITMKEAWEQHRSGSQSGSSENVDDLGVKFESPEFGRPDSGDPRPGRYTGTVKRRSDGTVIRSPAGEPTPHDPEPEPEKTEEKSGGSSKGGGD